MGDINQTEEASDEQKALLISSQSISLVSIPTSNKAGHGTWLGVVRQ
ncbi:MAG: hypothetical protein VYD89_00985 [Candidatus Thermoplasmatota archaeon]|nr:hypothetical protein [Candidatus Thermoplasmatota archaeon]MED5302977.1 hypothetical protein [Candidatus Thermoplasmatota archaeon]